MLRCLRTFQCFHISKRVIHVLSCFAENFHICWNLFFEYWYYAERFSFGCGFCFFGFVFLQLPSLTTFTFYQYLWNCPVLLCKIYFLPFCACCEFSFLWDLPSLILLSCFGPVFKFLPVCKLYNVCLNSASWRASLPSILEILSSPSAAQWCFIKYFGGQHFETAFPWGV